MQREAAESEVQSFGPAETRFTPSDMNSLVNDFDSQCHSHQQDAVVIDSGVSGE